jgi:hypothetical protein
MTERKKSLWEQMGRDVPPMTTKEVQIKPKTKEDKLKEKSLWEKMGRKPLF